MPDPAPLSAEECDEIATATAARPRAEVTLEGRAVAQLHATLAYLLRCNDDHNGALDKVERRLRALEPASTPEPDRARPAPGYRVWQGVDTTGDYDPTDWWSGTHETSGLPKWNGIRRPTREEAVAETWRHHDRTHPAARASQQPARGEAREPVVGVPDARAGRVRVWRELPKKYADRDQWSLRDDDTTSDAGVVLYHVSTGKGWGAVRKYELDRCHGDGPEALALAFGDAERAYLQPGEVARRPDGSLWDREGVRVSEPAGEAGPAEPDALEDEASELEALRSFAKAVRAARDCFRRQWAECDYNDERRTVYADYVRNINEALTALDQARLRELATPCGPMEGDDRG
jgi:hypothetical protein